MIQNLKKWSFKSLDFPASLPVGCLRFGLVRRGLPLLTTGHPFPLIRLGEERACVTVGSAHELRHTSMNVFTRMDELMNECMVERTARLKVV